MYDSLLAALRCQIFLSRETLFEGRKGCGDVLLLDVIVRL